MQTKFKMAEWLKLHNEAKGEGERLYPSRPAFTPDRLDDAFVPDFTDEMED